MKIEYNITDQTLKKLKFKRITDPEGFYYWVKRMGNYNTDFDLISCSSDERIDKKYYKIFFWGEYKNFFKSEKEIKDVYLALTKKKIC